MTPAATFPPDLVRALLDAAPDAMLVVDDDAAVRDATRLLLEVAGYRMTLAASVAEAVRCVRDCADVDVLVTDYDLGSGVTGLEAITAVRALQGSDLNALLVAGDTAAAAGELRRDARTRMASKPLKPDEFLSLLASLCGEPASAS